MTNGCRNPALLEEALRHPFVIVLARVYEHFFVAPAKGARENRNLHEFRACTHDGNYLHLWCQPLN
jgi:hypothetical protein